MLVLCLTFLVQFIKWDTIFYYKHNIYFESFYVITLLNAQYENFVRVRLSNKRSVQNA